MSWAPRGLGDSIYRERYAAHPAETWEQASRRIAKAVSEIENTSKRKSVEQEFFTEINDGRFQPGGRIMRNAGNKVQSLLNCFVIPVEDSIQGWGRTVSDLMTISSAGGGVGMNFSPL